MSGKDENIPDREMDWLKNPEIMRQHMEEGKTFQEILGYQQDKMESYYQTARRLFEKQEYKKAADAFVFLTTLNPYVHSYWLGLGMSEQLDGGHQGALLAYAMAILTDVNHPVAHYHSATCYRALNDQLSAINSLDFAISCSEGQEEFETIKEQAIAAKLVLENEMKK